jgi:hypothetical protein
MEGAAGWIVLGVVGGVVLTLAVLWLIRRPTGSWAGVKAGAPTPPSADAGEVARLRQNLRLKTLHNEDLIDRLVQAERERTPGVSEVECYRAAVERWERDNR